MAPDEDSSVEGLEGCGGRDTAEKLPPGLPTTAPPRLALLVMLPLRLKLPLDAVDPSDSALLPSWDTDCKGPQDPLRCCCGSVVDWRWLLSAGMARCESLR